jgi:predicted DNA-binding transcriptional regulator YafY
MRKPPKFAPQFLLFAKIWKMFESGRQLSAHDVADSLEVTKRTAWHWMAALRDQRLIHIVAWRKDTIGRDQTPVYSVGDGFDKPKSRRTPEDRRRKYHDKRARMAKEAT